MKSKIFFCVIFLFLFFLSGGYSQSESELFGPQIEKLRENAKYMKIQTEAAEFTRRKLYIAALNSIKNAIKNDFKYNFNENANPENIAKINELMKKLNAQLDILTEKNYFSLLDEAVNSFAKTVYSKQSDAILKHFNDTKKTLAKHAKIRNEILQIKNEIQNLYKKNFNSDNSDGAVSEDSLQILFILKFISGMENVQNSGILGCFDFNWNNLIKNMNDAVFTVLENYYNEFIKHLNNENQAGIYEAFYNIEQYVGLQKNTLDLYGELNRNGEDDAVNPIEYYYVLCETLKTLGANAIKIYETSAELNKLESELKNEKKIAQNLCDFSSRITRIVGEKDDYNLQNFKWFSEYKKLKKDLWNSLLLTRSFLVEKIFIQAGKMQAELWGEISRIYENNADLFIADAENFLSAAQKFLQGFGEKIPNDNSADFWKNQKNIEKIINFAKSAQKSKENDYEIIYYYPDFAEKILSAAKRTAAENKKTMENYLNEIKNNFDFFNADFDFKNGAELKSSFERLKNQNDKLQKTIQKIDETLALAENKIFQSELAKNEADLNFSEAEKALKNRDFETARKKLQNSLKKYDDALNIRNDETLRVECDKKLYELGAKIANEENEIVVKETRVLKNRAKDAYFNRRFEEAEKLLNQAKSRWETTNNIPDEEIVALSNFVNVAISMKTGRDLPRTAPQYPEMSQLLNIAHKYFNEGNAKIAQNDKKGGFADFDVALENIYKIQLVYPLNQDASILTLKINRIKEPQKFEEEFGQKINAAKLMCENPKTRKEGYANLLDYYELEPSRKGLKDLLWKTEIEIGIRQKEPDNLGIKKANQLFNEAQKIYENADGDEKKLNQALKIINQSLNIAADNFDAVKLKDKIAAKIGGNVIAILSTEDERLYQLAVQKLQANNVIGADVILQKILEKPANASLQKVRDLKNKIEARR